MAGNGEARGGRHLGADQRHKLGPAAILAARLEAEGAELLDQVGDGAGLAFGAGRAALQRVGGEGAGPVGQMLRIDRRVGGGRGGVGRVCHPIREPAGGRAAGQDEGEEQGEQLRHDRILSRFSGAAQGC